MFRSALINLLDASDAIGKYCIEDESAFTIRLKYKLGQDYNWQERILKI